MMGADITTAIRMSFIGAILCTHYSRPLILYTVPLYFFQSPCLDQSVRQYRHNDGIRDFISSPHWH
jgi:Na+/phosphate symporter